MMFKYHGDVEGLNLKLQEYGDRLEGAYRDMVGDDLIDRFCSESERLLTDDSFRGAAGDDAERILDGSRSLPSFGISMFFKSSDGSERISLTDGTENGSIREMHTAPTFYLPAECFENRARTRIPKYLDHYIHEFNHFIAYVVQTFPSQALSHIPIMAAKSLGCTGTDIVGVMEDARHKCPEWRDLFQFLYVISEGTAKAMDIGVWKRLGYDRSDVMISDLGERVMEMADVNNISDDDLRRFLKRWHFQREPVNPFVRECVLAIPRCVRVYKYPIGEYNERLTNMRTQ